MTGKWWPGVAERCAKCSGKMIVDPPTYEKGRLLCMDCGREVADVVVKRCAPYVPALVPCPRDGRLHSEMARCPTCVNREQSRQRRALARKERTG